LSDKQLPIDKILNILSATPPRIAELTNGLEPAQLHTPPGQNEWSLNDVLAHLRACGQVWGGYIRTILAEDRPTIRAVSPRTWIKQTDYLEQEFRPSFHAFARQRAELLTILHALPPESWSRVARVIAVGRDYERSVLDYADRLARHERGHVRQIENIVNTIRGL
jgi:hypothetical protein